MKKILITGGAGFIGYHLAKRLASQGHKIVLADNFFRGKRNADFTALIKKPNVHFIKADLTEYKNWRKLGGGYDHVYHLVGINGTRLFYEIPHEVLRIGVSSTMNALDWFRTVNKKRTAKILYTSSNEAYAGALEAFNILPLPTPERVPLVISDTYNPRWSYGGQKLIGELFFIHYAKAYNFRMSIVRPHNFYGPRAGYEHVIPELIARIAAKPDQFIYFSPKDTRSFCYIDDAVEAIQAVMESSKTDGGTYHIGSTEETAIADLADTLFSLMHWRPTSTRVEQAPEGSPNRRLPHVSKIQTDVGWHAKTPLEEGLRATIEWYLKNPKPITRKKAPDVTASGPAPHSLLR